MRVILIAPMWILLLGAICCFQATCATPGPTGFEQCSGSEYQRELIDYLYKHLGINATVFYLIAAKYGKATNVTLDPCAKSPCQVQKGVNATAFITFVPSKLQWHSLISSVL